MGRGGGFWPNSYSGDHSKQPTKFADVTNIHCNKTIKMEADKYIFSSQTSRNLEVHIEVGVVDHSVQSTTEVNTGIFQMCLQDAQEYYLQQRWLCKYD